jgi:preprotein translocase subunit SecD
MRKSRFIFAILVTFLLFRGSFGQTGTDSTVLHGPETDTAGLTGFYLVAAEADSADSLHAGRSDQQVVLYDYRFLLESERGKPRFLLLSRTPDVSLTLSGAPELIDQGRNGSPELRFELTPESSLRLENLTREHPGGKVALVIDGQPVTIHKIRSTIAGGRFQLTRCSDTGCRMIYGRLLKNRAPSGDPGME